MGHRADQAGESIGPVPPFVWSANNRSYPRLLLCINCPPHGGEMAAASRTPTILRHLTAIAASVCEGNFGVG